MDRRRLAALALGCAVLFSAGAARIGVIDADEARFALAVREMSERGDWVLPTNWGQLRYQKPILAYWLGRVSQSIFGPSEWALRLPSLLCVTGAVLLTAGAAARRFGERAGWRAGWILATALMPVVLAHAFTADAALLLGTTASFWAWARLREAPERAWPWQLLFWLGVAWGALAKGVNLLFLAAAGAACVYAAHDFGARTRRALAAVLVGGAVAVSIPGLGAAGPVVIAGLIVGFAGVHLARRDDAPGVDLGWRVGLPLAVALFAVWGVPAWLATEGRFFQLAVGGDLVARSARSFEGHWGVPGYYLLTGLVAFFPWAALVPAALASLRPELARDARLRFLVCWIVGPWLLLELATTKLPHYTTVAFPALAVLVALETERRAAGGGPEGRALRLFEAAPAALLAAAALLVIPAAFWFFDDTRVRLAAAGFGALAAVVGGSWMRRLARGGGDPFAGLALGAAALYLVFFGVVGPAVERLRIAEPIGRAVARQLRPDDRLVLHGVRHESVAYASPRVPELLRDGEEVAAALGDPRTLMIVPEHRLERVLAAFPARYERVDSAQGLLLARFEVQTIWLVRGVAPGEALPSRSGTSRSGTELPNCLAPTDPLGSPQKEGN